MVHYLSCGIGLPIINDPRTSPLTQMKYANPAEVHYTALQEGTVQMQQGYWIDPLTAPKSLLWESKPADLPDVITHKQVLVTCDRFRNLVERYEPGVHQFIPVDIFVRGVEQPVKTHFWFVVGQRLDSVDPDHTNYKWKLDYTGKSGFWSDRDVESPRLVFSAKKAEGHHIWVDPGILVMNSRLCSDEFAAAALAEHFSGLEVTARETV